MPDALLEVRDLVVRYKRGVFAAPGPAAVDGVSLTLPKGQTLGIVGESGSGKSSLLRAILRLVPVASGSILLNGQDYLALNGPALRQARHSIGVVAQNPFLSLSPRLTIAQILEEPMQAARLSGDHASRAASLLSQCGLPPDFLTRRARELSGGQAQRVAIARALTLSPSLLVLDEPTSALDVSVQAQILNLLGDLKAQLGLSMLFVTHNLKVVAHISDSIMVMQRGKVVEAGETDQIIHAPVAVYTKQLMGFGQRR